MPFGSFPPQVRRRVVVTGLGAVTPLGLSVSATWAALCKGVSAACSLSEVPFFFPPCLEVDARIAPEEKQRRREQLMAALPCQVAAPVRADSHATDDPSHMDEGVDGRATNWNKPDNFTPTTRETRAMRFAQHATREALAQARFLEVDVRADDRDGSSTHASSPMQGSSLPYLRDRVGVNIGVGMPSLADVCDVSHSMYSDPNRVNYSRINPFFVPKILGNMMAGQIAIKYGITGPIGSSVAACATGAQCIGEAASWIRTGRADAVICGASEACITPVSIAGFTRMRALCTKYNETPHEASRPFDKGRGGFIMGEGAGVILLEEMEQAVKRGATIIAELRGFGISCDAHDVAAPHPEGRGAEVCVRLALKDGGDVPPSCVAYVNAHATGTIGDDVELNALNAALNGDDHADPDKCHKAGVCINSNSTRRHSPLCVSSVKGAIGHLLGAAGSVEAIVAVMALNEQRAPPNVNLSSPSSALSDRFTLPRGFAACTLQGEATISTSFGFGGVNTALLFTCAP
ncbi:Beta ketoacyl synthase N terminal domain [Trypanosoma vivax]|uniref:beta-ketoacyl-[acyl-carrier-protein] synthase I n=1 Tax=Trypanosoma vivax (strain Y486) TaxID=1055687 RepID=G0TRV8_TRYVY|nr:putative beta-ketoacyl synthase family protein [Trypanosoma vivax]KAH8617336.1 Beta ketoacyl synthase N terminal domain [Trypanosoma vivax]CCC46681.1 putative beta-ketoacyl synthase family protein [Trypanosoma vivax Y486]